MRIWQFLKDTVPEKLEPETQSRIADRESRKKERVRQVRARLADLDRRMSELSEVA